MNVHEHSTDKLSAKDFQFSLARILIAITLLCVLLAMRLPVLFEQAGWVLWICIVLVVLYCDWGSLQVNSAQHALRAGDYERAVVLYTKAIGARSDDAIRYHGRAVARFYLGDFAAAGPDFDKALSLDARLAAAWGGRAQIHIHAGEVQQAVDKATVALCLAPEDPVLLQTRGVIYLQSDRFKDALDDLNEAIRIVPESWRAFDLRATALVELEKYEEALLDLSAATEQQGSYGGRQIAQSVVLFRLGRFQDALAEINRHLNEEPNSIEAICVLSQMLATCPDPAFRNGTRALELANEASKRGRSGEWMCILAFAAAHGELGDFVRASDFAENALRTAPRLRQTRIRKQLECYQMGKPYYSER